MHCRFYHQNNPVDDSVYRPTKIRDARFNKNYFKTYRTFIRISLVDFWKIWFEKCPDSCEFLKYGKEKIVRYLMFRRGQFGEELGQKIKYFAEQVLTEQGEKGHQQANRQNAD